MKKITYKRKREYVCCKKCGATRFNKSKLTGRLFCRKCYTYPQLTTKIVENTYTSDVTFTPLMHKHSPLKKVEGLGYELV